MFRRNPWRSLRLDNIVQEGCMRGKSELGCRIARKGRVLCDGCNMQWWVKGGLGLCLSSCYDFSDWCTGAVEGH